MGNQQPGTTGSSPKSSSSRSSRHHPPPPQNASPSSGLTTTTTTTNTNHNNNNNSPKVNANQAVRSTADNSMNLTRTDTPSKQQQQQQQNNQQQQQHHQQSIANQHHLAVSVASPPVITNTTGNKELEIVDPAIQENFIPMQSGLPQLETNSPYYFPGYCGYLERVEAEQFIMFKPPGTFLIRWSDNKRFYVISYIDEQKKMQHMGNIEIGVDKKTTRVTKGNQRQFFPSMSAYISFLGTKNMIDTPFESVAYINSADYAVKIQNSPKKTEYEDFDD